MFFINWEKLKTFLIVLFAFLNVFLITFTFVQNSKYDVISDETINDTVKILKSKGINLDAAKISKKQINLSALTLKNAVVSHNFPSGFERYDDKNFSVETDGNLSSESEIKKVLLSIGIKDNFEIYSNAANADDDEKILNGDNSQNEKNVSSEKTISSEKNIVNNENSLQNEKIVYLKIDNFPVFDVFLRLNEENGKVKIVGSWYFCDSKPRKSSDTSDIVSLTGILIDFSNIAEFDGEINVDKIELGYYISDANRSLERLNVNAAPCWKISSSDNKNYYYNARNGEFLKKTQQE